MPTLLLTGTIGSGKTVVAAEIGLLLEQRGAPVAVIDLDWLNWVHLGPRFDGFDDLLVRNLTAVWPNFVAAGARSFVLVRALQRQSTIDALRAALPEAELTVVRLVASPATIQERLRRRDTGAILLEHLEESRRFARAMDEAVLEGTVVSSDGRTIGAVAADVIEQWRAR